MELLQDFLSIFIKIFLGNMLMIKDELDHFKERFSKLVQIFVSKSTGCSSTSRGSEWQLITPFEWLFA
jgi:hypothetical protein